MPKWVDPPCRKESCQNAENVYWLIKPSDNYEIEQHKVAAVNILFSVLHHGGDNKRGASVFNMLLPEYGDACCNVGDRDCYWSHWCCSGSCRVWNETKGHVWWCQHVRFYVTLLFCYLLLLIWKQVYFLLLMFVVYRVNFLFLSWHLCIAAEPSARGQNPGHAVSPRYGKQL